MAPIAARLIYLTMGTVADYLFGGDDSARAQAVLGRLFRSKSNIFSYELTDVAVAGDELLGLLVSSPWRKLQTLDIPTAYQLARASGILGLIRMIARSRPFIGVKEAEDDEYFVAHLAVLPPFEGHGIGQLLLSHAEAKAKRAGFSTIALTVEVDNERALSLYSRRGFRVIETRRFPALKDRIRYNGFHRMAKALA